MSKRFTKDANPPLDQADALADPEVLDPESSSEDEDYEGVSDLEREEELSVEIVVPSLLSPLPRLTLVGLLLARQRLAVIEESHHEFGVSAELVASLAEAGYRGKIIRVGMPPVPIAAARSLERTQLPDEQLVFDSVLGLF